MELDFILTEGPADFIPAGRALDSAPAVRGIWDNEHIVGEFFKR